MEATTTENKRPDTVRKHRPGLGKPPSYPEVTLSTILSASPAELHATGGGWHPFLDRPSHIFHGWCVDPADDDAGCGNPWSLDLRTSTLTQCGCPEFVPGAVLPAVAGVLARIDLTPAPRRVAWRYIEPCGSAGLSSHCDGGWFLDVLTRSVVPCRCGFPLALSPWEIAQ